jgi:hypothetical protein
MSVLPRVLSCAVVLAATPSLAAAPKKQPAPGASVTLRFAWPEALQAQVSDTQSTGPLAQEGAPEVSVTQRYPLKVETRGEERWLVPGPVEVTPAQFAQVLQGVPTLVISPAGELLRAEVSQATVEATTKLMVAMSDSKTSPAAEARLREQLQQKMTETAREEWSALVGQWRDVTLRPGRTETRKTTLKSWTMGGKPLEAEERTTVEEAVPCEAEATDTRCVRIRRETVVTPKALARLRKEREAGFNEGLLQGMARTQVKQLHLRATLELVTDPATLVPYRLREEGEEWMLSSHGKEPATKDGMRKVREVVFTYPK